MCVKWPETHFKIAINMNEFSDMRPNLGGEGRDPGQLGQCPDSHRLLVLKASLIIITKLQNYKMVICF